MRRPLRRTRQHAARPTQVERPRFSLPELREGEASRAPRGPAFAALHDPSDVLELPLQRDESVLRFDAHEACGGVVTDGPQVVRALDVAGLGDARAGPDVRGPLHAAFEQPERTVPCAAAFL